MNEDERLLATWLKLEALALCEKLAKVSENLPPEERAARVGPVLKSLVVRDLINHADWTLIAQDVLAVLELKGRFP